MKQDRLTKPEKRAQILSAVETRAREDPRFARKVLEAVKERRKLDGGPCLQDGASSSVTGTVVTDSAGGSAVHLDYSFSAVNNCPDPIDNIEFHASEIYDCPVGCAQTSGVKPVSTYGIPGAIGQNVMSQATAFDQLACERTDSNGAVTPQAPTGLTVTIQAEGRKASGSVQSTGKVFKLV